MLDQPDHPKPEHAAKSRVQKAPKNRDSLFVRGSRQFQNGPQCVEKHYSDLDNVKPQYNENGKFLREILGAHWDFNGFKTKSLEPDVLERMDDRNAPELNWIAESPKPGAYLAKIAFDPDSMAGLTNTLSQLALKHKTKIGYCRIEFIDEWRALRHRDRYDNLLKEDQEMSIEDEDMDDIQFCDAEDEDENDIQSCDAEDEEDLDSDVVCGNHLCGQKGHTLAQCVVVDPYHGMVYGCPLCNTSDHLIDGPCPKRPNTDPGPQDPGAREYIELLLDTLVVQRADKPSLATLHWAWPQILSCYVDVVKEFDSIESLDRSRFNIHGHYPWTHTYGMELSNTEEKRRRLWEFEASKGGCLSQDPFWTELGTKSLSETITAFLQGKWTLPTPLCPNEQDATSRLSRAGYIQAKAYDMVASSYFRVKSEQGEIPPVPIKPTSFAAPSIVHTALGSTHFVMDDNGQWIMTPDWTYTPTTEGEESKVLRRIDPEADYYVEYAVWKVQHLPDDGPPVPGSLEDQALRAVIEASARFKRKMHEWMAHVEELERQGQEKRRAREAEDNWARY